MRFYTVIVTYYPYCDSNSNSYCVTTRVPIWGSCDDFSIYYYCPREGFPNGDPMMVKTAVPKYNYNNGTATCASCAFWAFDNDTYCTQIL